MHVSFCAIAKIPQFLKKCKIACEKKSDVILHILSLYGAPSLFCPASPWPLHSQNPGAAADVACTLFACLICQVHAQETQRWINKVSDGLKPY